jgi:hypothetical protein
MWGVAWSQVDSVIGQEWFLGGNTMRIKGLLALTIGESRFRPTLNRCLALV